MSADRTPWERWLEDGVVEGLGQGGNAAASAHGVSADGSVIVGRANDQPFRWVDFVTESLGLLPGDTEGGATAVSADGSVVLGYSGTTPFLWDATLGMRDLWSVLTIEYGLDLTGWTLVEALDLSADGLVVAGWGINPLGQTEGWVASMRTSVAAVPTPSTLPVLLGGALLLLAVVRRRGASIAA